MATSQGSTLQSVTLAAAGTFMALWLASVAWDLAADQAAIRRMKSPESRSDFQAERAMETARVLETAGLNNTFRSTLVEQFRLAGITAKSPSPWHPRGI